MDKNTIIGFVLIGIVLIAFSWFNRPTPEQVEAQRRYQDSIAKIEYLQGLEVQRQDAKEIAEDAELTGGELSDSIRMTRMQAMYGAFAGAMSGNDGYTVLENDFVEIRISNKGGHVMYARLKEYDNWESEPLVLFDEDEVVFDFTLITAGNRVINTRDMYFEPVKGNDPNEVTMRLSAGTDSYLDFKYTLSPDDYSMKYSIRATGLNGVLSPNTNSLDLAWEQDIRQQEKGRKFEDRYAALYYKFVADDVENLSEGKNDSKKVANRLKWIGYKDMFFSTVLIADSEGFEAATLESSLSPEEGKHLKHYKTATTVPFDIQGRESTDFTYFFVPNKYALLKEYDKDIAADDRLELDRLVYLGGSVFRWLNKYFVIPVFDFLGHYSGNYGLIIFLLTLVIKIVIFPMTYKSYMSSAKMRVLRPQVEEINGKYPGESNAMARQKATMELYSRAGASPMSGCIPMLLQMPVLIAMFMFFPSAIELRHEAFLWAKDLSTYDAIVSWNTHIPLITPYFGNHISLFCLLMAAVQILYSKYSMEMTNTGQQQMPGMKAMMYMMPLMMMLFFNQYASGLTYYYFISTLMTILQTLAFRFFINEEKLLAKLEANKKKPQKKSGFMKRLEEAQRQQEEVLRKQKDEQAKRQHRSKR